MRAATSRSSRAGGHWSAGRRRQREADNLKYWILRSTLPLAGDQEIAASFTVSSPRHHRGARCSRSCRRPVASPGREAMGNLRSFFYIQSSNQLASTYSPTSARSPLSVGYFRRCSITPSGTVVQWVLSYYTVSAVLTCVALMQETKRAGAE
jgi:hypothetical protein